MAFVVDQNDPNSQGMFSKAGRFTSEKYMIFQKKDEILNNQRKFLKVTSLPHLKMDFDTKDPSKNLHDDDDEKPRVTPNNKTRPQIEPFSMQQSRQEFYEVKKNKNPPPPCGFYNPKFYHVDRKVQTLFRYNKEKSKKILSATMSDFNMAEITKSAGIPERVKLKVVGPTPLHLQKGRDELKSAKSVGNDPHESRFTVLHFPSNSGRVKRPMTVDMNKSMGREANSLYKSLEYSPDYAPNFEFGKKSLGSPGPTFDRMSSRKTLAHISYSINENPFDTSHIENLKYPKPRTVLFDKFSPREFDPSSPLPSFMQKSVNSRHALGSVRQKTLEINNFSDGKFQTLYSSFSPNQSQKSFFKEKKK